MLVKLVKNKKVKFVIISILVFAIPVLVVSGITLFIPNTFNNWGTVGLWSVPIFSLLCGIFITIKVDEKVLGKFIYFILTTTISFLFFSLVNAVPLFFLYLGSR